MRVALCNDGATTNEAPRADEEAGCGRETGATEWGGAGATMACNAAAAGRKAVPVGSLAGWQRAMARWL